MHNGEMSIRYDMRKTCTKPAINEVDYNIWLIGMVIYGLLMNIVFYSLFPPENYSTYYFIYLMGYLLAYIIGFLLSNSNLSALLSFIGYNMVVVPIGWIASLTLYALFDVEFEYIPIIPVCYIAITVTTILLIIGCVSPLKFLSKKFSLFVAAAVTMLLCIGISMFGVKLNLMTCICATICNCYIAYNTHRAQIFPQTRCNAINSAMDICVDIIFLFMILIEAEFEIPDSLEDYD